MAVMRFEFEDAGYEIDGELTTREWKLVYRHAQLSPAAIEDMDPMDWPPGVWTGFLHVAIKRARPMEHDEQIIKHLDDQPLEKIITSFKGNEEEAGQSPPTDKQRRIQRAFWRTFEGRWGRLPGVADPAEWWFPALGTLGLRPEHLGELTASQLDACMDYLKASRG